MNLNLKFEPSPENAPEFASTVVEIARNVSGASLDYSPQSLAVVDTIIQGFATEGCAVDDVKETLFCFGCYVGEVFVRASGARWITASEKDEKLYGFPMIVELTSGAVCNPIGKVFKRLELGQSENLPYFYAVFAGVKQWPALSPVTPWWKRILGIR